MNVGNVHLGSQSHELVRGKVALVTGSSRGLGREIAIRLGEAGASLVVSFREQQGLAIEVTRLIIDAGGEAFCVGADVRRPEDVRRLVDEAIECYGKIDILVNNAGIHDDAITAKMPDQAWRDVLDVNLTGTFNCTREVIPHMIKEGWGRILNISSVVAFVGLSGTSNYAAAKAGILGFTRAVARELVSNGITVNALALGYFDTGMLRRLPKKTQESILRQIPAGRFGRPREVGQTIVFLCSEDAGYITGQVLHINGGYVS